MPRIAYVNGQYMPLAHATTHIEDRGYQLADSVYDALMVRDSIFVDEHPHLKRLERSLSEIKISMPMSFRALQSVVREVVTVTVFAMASFTFRFRAALPLAITVFQTRKFLHRLSLPPSPRQNQRPTIWPRRGWESFPSQINVGTDAISNP